MNGVEITAADLTGAGRYVKKPIPIKASPIHETFWVHSLEGDHQGKAGDYVIQGVRGEIYICDRDIFHETYRPVSSVRAHRPAKKAAVRGKPAGLKSMR